MDTYRGFTIVELLIVIVVIAILAALSVVENARRLKKRAPVPESVVSIPDTLIQKLTAKLPYPLTGDQRRSIGEIVADMASPLPMRRVLSGDVGSGKTL